MAKSTDGLRYTAENPHVINEIVDTGLCVRCGACEPACPVDIIRFDARTAYPYITEEESCIQACTRCLKVCPGGEVDFNKLDDEMFGRRPHPQSITGIVRGSYVSFSTNDEVRYKGASGGFVTEILTYMLDNKLIDGALVLTTTADENGWREHAMIARTVEELRRAQKSKYLVVPALTPLAEMEKIEGTYAVVALPCYVHAIRKYQKVSPKLRKRLKYVIGLYCNVALEPNAYTDLCELKGIDFKDVTGLDFRFGDWPGGIHAAIKGGEPVKVLKHEEMKDEFNTMKLFYTPTRCNMCIDFSAEHADISVGDPWLRGPDGEYIYTDGRTTVLTRTDDGVKIVDDAVRDGYIKLEPIPIETYMVNFEKAARYKRDLVPYNIRLRRKLGLKAPEYSRPITQGLNMGLMKYKKAVKANILHLLSRYKWIRKLGLRLAQTPPIILYFRWNRGRKARKFAQGYPAALEFVAQLRQTDDRPAAERKAS